MTSAQRREGVEETSPQSLDKHKGGDHKMQNMWTSHVYAPDAAAAVIATDAP